ncbi:MAG: hypothetical protein OXG82_06520 [Gammaproteobacteria bacterium]|nr:hypothetical protein [Gammaproteobacteria bacterium]
MKRSWEEVETELWKLHSAGEIDLDAPAGRATDGGENANDRAIRDAIWRIQGFEGRGRDRICAECGKRFWGPWIAYVLCSAKCNDVQNKRRFEIMRRYRWSAF